MESNTRSICKAVSYRIVGSIATALLFLAFTGNLTLSLGAGGLDIFVKTGLYFLHERIWNIVSFGRKRPPEYEI